MNPGARHDGSMALKNVAAPDSPGGEIATPHNTLCGVDHVTMDENDCALAPVDSEELSFVASVKLIDDSPAEH